MPPPCPSPAQVDILRSRDVDVVPTVDSPFDPNVHEAIMREPSDEVPDGTVLMEFRKGFKMGERLLRPAMVKVRGTQVYTTAIFCQGPCTTTRDCLQCGTQGNLIAGCVACWGSMEQHRV
jgi:hypothetical protein